MQQFEYLKSFHSEKVPELSKEFGDVFRFWLASITTAAEALEVDVQDDRRLLPYREKSVEARNSKTKIKSAHPGPSFGRNFEATY